MSSEQCFGCRCATRCFGVSVGEENDQPPTSLRCEGQVRREKVKWAGRGRPALPFVFHLPVLGLLAVREETMQAACRAWAGNVRDVGKGGCRAEQVRRSADGAGRCRVAFVKEWCAGVGGTTLGVGRTGGGLLRDS